MRHPEGTLTTLVAGRALAAGVLVGGSPGSVRIPPGARQVHVASTGTEARLDPPSMRAGDVWICSVDRSLFR